MAQDPAADLLTIARVRRAMPRNPEVIRVCELAEQWVVDRQKPKFDKKAYQREYMRALRAKRRRQ